jgi:hypothetical protein
MWGERSNQLDGNQWECGMAVVGAVPNGCQCANWRKPPGEPLSKQQQQRWASVRGYLWWPSFHAHFVSRGRERVTRSLWVLYHSAWSCQGEGAMMVGPAVVYIHFSPNQALSGLNIKFKDFVCHWGFIRDGKLFWSLWGGTKLTSVCCRHNSGHLHRRALMASERSLLQFTGWCESLSTNCRELCKCWSLANAAKA